LGWNEFEEFENVLNEINYVLFGNWKRYSFQSPPQLRRKGLPHTPLNRGKNNKHFNWICIHVYFDPFCCRKWGSKFSLMWSPWKLAFMILYFRFYVSVHSAKFAWKPYQNIKTRWRRNYLKHYYIVIHFHLFYDDAGWKKKAMGSG
jgi:hypothetical protein